MKIQSAGRLGNTLFIWAFALNFAKQNNKKVSVFIDRYHSDINQEATETMNLLQTDEVNLLVSNFWGLYVKIVDWFRYALHMEFIGNYLGVSFEDEPNFTEKMIIRGYFQDTKYVSKNLSFITGKLQEVLKMVATSSPIVASISAEFPRYQVVHIRLGDFADSVNGIVDPKSFSHLVDVNLPLVVCTNGLIEEVEHVANFRVDKVITAVESTAWETLAIIDNADQFIGVNSTLSWWGAFIASAKNKPTYLPRQWKSYLPNRQSNLSSWQGVKLYEATFRHP